jgi:hypothetical protein
MARSSNLALTRRPFTSFHPTFSLQISARGQILGISICFIELSYPLFVWKDLLFSLVYTRSTFGDWAGNGNVSLHCYIGALERIDEFRATIAAAYRRVAESSVSVEANDRRVVSLQRL